MCWYVGTEPSEELLADLTGHFVSRSRRSFAREIGSGGRTDSEGKRERPVDLCHQSCGGNTRHFEVPAGFRMIRGKTAGTLGRFRNADIRKPVGHRMNPAIFLNLLQ
jgi:hypothetical protein